ncbi:hypothetical protein ACFFIX_18330 [Metabacillus herbersteinensis]|uniref:Uncharacterized protein n=1 Tax=Metabacillus herbersteinensis TaxID=283816 RepID=A0ABV6GI54_9BACI
MMRDSKLTIVDFINKDRFELNSYITHLFSQINNHYSEKKEDRF